MNSTRSYRGTTEWNSWSNMKQRCVCPKPKDALLYKDAGITVCDEWKCRGGFKRFLADMGPKPTPRHSIERIDTTKGYFKENCKWATDREQQRNKRNNRIVEYNGQSKTLIEWTEELGLEYCTVKQRLYRGLPPEQAFAKIDMRLK